MEKTNFSLIKENLAGLLFLSVERMICWGRNQIYFWNLESEVIEDKIAVPERVISVAASEQKNLLACSTEDNSILFFDLIQKKLLIKISEPEAAFLTMSFNPAGNILAAATTSDLIKIFQTDTFQPLKILSGYTGYIQEILFSNNQTFFSGGWDDRLYCWQISAAKPLKSEKAYLGQIRLLNISPKMKVIVAAGNDYRFIINDLNSLTLKTVVRAHTAPLHALKTCQERIFSAGEDKMLKCWSAQGDLLFSSERFALIKKISAHEQSGKIAILFADNAIEIFNISECKTEKILNKKEILFPVQKTEEQKESPAEQLLKSFNYARTVWTIAFHPQKQLLAAAGADTIIRIWNVSGQKIFRELIAHKGAVFALDFHPAGKMLASCGEDSRIIVWDFEKGLVVKTLAEENLGALFALRFSPAGNLLAAAGDKGFIYFWKLPSFEYLKKIETAGKIFCLQFLQEKEIASSDEQGVIKVFKIE